MKPVQLLESWHADDPFEVNIVLFQRSFFYRKLDNERKSSFIIPRYV